MDCAVWMQICTWSLLGWAAVDRCDYCCVFKVWHLTCEIEVAVTCVLTAALLLE